MENWNRVADKLPPQNEVVETKIDDHDGLRNEQKLKLQGKLWWHSDGKMYVYYTPTHWKTMAEPPSTVSWDDAIDG